MKGKASYFLICIGLISFTCCSPFENAKYLTDNIRGKYWDLIYHTDTSGIMQEVLVRKSNLPTKTFFFSKVDITRYYIYDSVRVIDMNYISGDKVYSYEYELKRDTLIFDGSQFIILGITRDSLKLQSIKQEKLQYFFVASKFQNRIVLDKLPTSSN